MAYDDREEAMRVQRATEDMIRMRTHSPTDERQKRLDRMERALRPFAQAYAAAADPISDSDLDNEQPRHVTVTLGDCRRAASLLGIYPKAKP